MTAIVAILNKTTVALAADSAATVTGPQGQKVYNHAHKLFNLSSHHPVGLMIYNWLDLVGIPWETIVKMYRRKLGHCSFPTIPEYAEDFLQYIERFKPQLDLADRNNAVNTVANDVCNLLWNDIQSFTDNEPGFYAAPEDEKQGMINNLITTKLLPDSLSAYSELSIPTALASYDLEAFETEYGTAVRLFVATHLNDKHGLVLTSTALTSVTRIVYEFSLKLHDYGAWSGLVFTGFGEEQIYPHLTSYRIGPVFGNSFRITPDREVKISSQHPCDIVPYAQKDVILSFITGIDPLLKEAFESTIADTLHTVVADIIPLLTDEQQVQVQLRKEEAIQTLKSNINHISHVKNTKPIIETVALLSKEDIADMAESLISLTSLKRRVSFVLESVGGPVDVAVITKGEGFIWIKRKQYFKPELNLNYLSGVLSRPLTKTESHVPYESESHA